MEQSDLVTIKKRSLVGVVALTSRTFLLQIVAFIATFFLTIFLSPATFGVFYVVSAIISFLGYFSDIGLAAALVQKKEEVTREDLVTTFTIQQLLVGFIVLIAFIFSSQVAVFYRLDMTGLWLLRALIVAFFLSSLKTIPSILLERRLEFQKLVVPNILETVTFYTVAVILAWWGFGVASFTWAVLARGVIGSVSMYAVNPWRPALSVSLVVIRKLLRFGVPFQINSFLALIKDDLLTVFLGKILPFAQVGYIGWAKKWAEVPLRLIMDSVIRVTFPAFSRLQHDKSVLGRAIESTLFGLSVTIFPITMVLLFFIEPLVALVPRYTKWEPAILSFVLFAVASAVASLSTPLTNALNAVGRIKTTLWLMVLWTVATWLLTVPLVRAIGFNGVALSLFLITSTIILVVYLVKKVSPFRFWASVKAAIAGVLVQAIFYGWLRGGPPYHSFGLILVGSGGAILYAAVVWLFERERLKSLVATFRQ